MKKTLNKNKAKNIVSLNLKGKSSIADYMVVASGSSSKHIQSLSEILLKELENNGFDKFKIEGRTSNEWKLIDAIDIIVHIFQPDKRKFYDLEKMWSETITNDRDYNMKKIFIFYF